MIKYLTWQDIKRIVNIADELIKTKDGEDIPECIEEDMPEYLETEEKYYTEVLNRFAND